MKVVLIEDQTLLNSTLIKALEQMKDIEVSAQSDKASDALRLCRAYKPDIVIMDIFTKAGNGIEYTAYIKEEFPDIKVFILTGVEDDSLVRAAEEAGADMFARKSLSLEELAQLVQYSQMPYRVFPSIASDTKTVRFTDLELHILKLMAQGKSTREIAAELYLGYGTIRVYISRMYATTGLKSRAQLVAYALKYGHIELA